MKKLIINTIAIAALSCTAVFAERIDVGGYFSIDIPARWRVAPTGRNLNDNGTYVIYQAEGKVAAVVIHVRNNDPDAMTLELWNRMTPADLERYAVYNHRAGWSQPTVRKDYINGIPALVENAVKCLSR